jgi:hypothetical protein
MEPQVDQILGEKKVMEMLSLLIYKANMILIIITLPRYTHFSEFEQMMTAHANTGPTIL